MAELLKVNCENCQKTCIALPIQAITLALMQANPAEKEVVEKILKLKIVFVSCQNINQIAAVTFP